MANRLYNENPYTDPANTHPDIIIDVPIPHEWESYSYKNDVCPSFIFGKLQIFVCDEKTKKLEQFNPKYTVMYADDYGAGYDPLLNSDDWEEVLKFVKDFKPAPTPAEKNKLLEKNIKLVSSLTVDEFQTKCEEYKIECSYTFSHMDNLIFELAELISIEDYKNDK